MQGRCTEIPPHPSFTPPRTFPPLPHPLRPLPGKHHGCVRVLPSGGVLLQLRWDAPYAGEGTDEFQLVGTDELHVTSRLQPLASPGRTIQYRTVYMRKRP